MEFPCEGCLVDPICIKRCEKLVDYFKYIDKTGKKAIPKNLVFNRCRYQRISHCCNYSELSYQLYTHLTVRLREYCVWHKNE